MVHVLTTFLCWLLSGSQMAAATSGIKPVHHVVQDKREAPFYLNHQTEILHIHWWGLSLWPGRLEYTYGTLYQSLELESGTITPNYGCYSIGKEWKDMEELYASWFSQVTILDRRETVTQGPYTMTLLGDLILFEPIWLWDQPEFGRSQLARLVTLADSNGQTSGKAL